MGARQQFRAKHVSILKRSDNGPSPCVRVVIRFSFTSQSAGVPIFQRFCTVFCHSLQEGRPEGETIRKALEEGKRCIEQQRPERPRMAQVSGTSCSLKVDQQSVQVCLGCVRSFMFYMLCSACADKFTAGEEEGQRCIAQQRPAHA